MKLDLSALNKEQLAPVLDTQGAVLVTAGAGSGKTRLLTHRIAHIVKDLNVPSYSILAITFTNKAAREMKERLGNMVPNPQHLWVSTFHSMCVTILRNYIHLMDRAPSFSIYDESERKKIIKKVAKSISPDDETLPDRISSALSQIKNSGIDLYDYVEIHKFFPDIHQVEQGVEKYEAEMRSSNALDFDDLLVLAYRVLNGYAEARDYYQGRFKYIHVDEFQDTNVIQYKLIKLLAGKHGNVLVVGDEDQSIYGWRGANINNIKDFIKDFNCKVYKLEQNYRSTKSILALANTVIKNNTSRIEKQLWTDNREGEKALAFNPVTETDEADFVMQTIKALHSHGLAYNNIAVLMRVNSLSRSIEQKFMFYGIPYRLYGGFKFYERKEIKDILAYLKILSNPLDNEAALRAIGFPKKGIGESSVEKMEAIAAENDISLVYLILACADDGDKALSSKLPTPLVKKIKPFAALLKQLFESKHLKVSNLLKLLYKLLNLDEVFGESNEDNESRKLNIRELVNSVMQTEQLNPDIDVDIYVQQIMLYGDLDEEKESDSVNVATIHSAKGLEYNTVFLIGLEEGIFPISRAMDNPSEIEEERRLMYVALTRAKERLYLTYTRTRFLYGKYTPSRPSRFLCETGIIAPYRQNEQGGFDDDYNYNKKQSNDYYKDYKKVQAPAKADPKPQQPTAFSAAKAFFSSGVSARDLSIGQRVKHKRLGEGIVKAIDKNNNQADIEFDSIGVITLAIQFAPITILD